MNKKGFSLIEMVIALSVSAILLTLGIGSYRKFSRQQQARSVIKQLKSDLRLAQVNALAGTKGTEGGSCPCGAGIDANCGTSDDPSLSGWEVRIPNASTYEVYGLCGAVQFKTTGLVGVDSNTMPTGITLSAAPVSTVRFLPVTGGTDLSSTMTITVSGTGVTSQNIIITSTGEIK